MGKERNELGKELLDLIAFLSRYVTDINKMRWEWAGMSPEECKEALLMQWPTIQGMRNQDNIAKLGDMSWDGRKVSKAVSLILESNASIERPTKPQKEG